MLNYSQIQPHVKLEISNALQAYANENQFDLSKIPTHSHTGADIDRVAFPNLTDKRVFVHKSVSGLLAATATNYGVIFIAPAPCVVLGVSEAHGTAGTDGGAVTLSIEKLISGVALNSGVDLIPTPFSLKATINVVQNATLTTIPGSLQLATGDRLALKDTGTLTTVADVCVIIELTY